MQKHIDSLNYDKEQLYKQIETLSAALTNAQALQGIEKHQRFIESKSDADATEQELKMTKEMDDYTPSFHM